jgi:hypothetical protein
MLELLKFTEHMFFVWFVEKIKRNEKIMNKNKFLHDLDFKEHKVLICGGYIWILLFSVGKLVLAYERKRGETKKYIISSWIRENLDYFVGCMKRISEGVREERPQFFFT